MIEPRDHQELYHKLERIERQIRRRSAVNAALRGGCLALAVGMLLTLAGKLLGLGSTVLFVSLSVALVFLLSGGSGILTLSRRRTLSHVARVCDRELGLKERLATAMEVLASNAPGPLPEAQVFDARQVLGAIDIGRAFGIRWSLRSSLLAFVLVAVFLTTLQLPASLPGPTSPFVVMLPARLDLGDQSSPWQAEATVPTSDQERQRELALRLQQIVDEVAAGRTPEEEISDRLDRVELELRQLLTRPDAAVQGAAALLSDRLGLLRQSFELKQSIGRRDYEDVVRRLGLLGSDLPALTAEDRLAITFILARGGRDDATVDPEVARLLEELSTAVTLGDADRLSILLAEITSTLGVEEPRPTSFPPDEMDGEQSP